MALVGVELETLVSEPDALPARPPSLNLLTVGIERQAGCKR